MPLVSGEQVLTKFRALPLHPREAIYHEIIEEGFLDTSLPNASAKGAKIAERLSQEFKGDIKQISWAFNDLMMLVAVVVKVLPPEHHFQDVLLEALRQLRQFPGPHPKLQFADLPKLRIFIKDFWLDRTATYNDYPNEIHNVEGDVLEWKCLSSFWARFCDDTWLMTGYALDECYRAFEEPTEKGYRMETRLWGATEWIIRCAKIWTSRLASADPVDEYDYMLGALLDGSHIHPYSKARWEFWKQRLLMIKADWATHELDEVTPERIDLAVGKLDEVLTTVEWKHLA